MRQERIHSHEATDARMKGFGKRSLLALTLAAAVAIAPLAVGGAPGQVSAATAAAPAYKPVQQKFNINGASSSISVLNMDSTTYVGLRMLNDKLGLQTGWDQASHTATVSGNGRTIKLNLKTGATELNGETIYGLPGLLVNNSTYVPLRFLLERMGYTINYDSASHVIGVVKLKENTLKIGTGIIKEYDAKQRLTLKVNYPVISGFADADVQDKINAYLKAEAQKYYTSGKTEMEQAAKDNAAYMASSGEELPPVEFQGSYYVTYNENNLLSLYVDYYSYTGGAHGGTNRVPYTFDLSTGDVLTLKDAAKGNANYVSIINAEIAKQIKADNMTLLEPFKTIEPDRPFYLNHNGLVIYFGQYEYTAYAYGMPEFVIPLKLFQ